MTTENVNPIKFKILILIRHFVRVPGFQIQRNSQILVWYESKAKPAKLGLYPHGKVRFFSGLSNHKQQMLHVHIVKAVLYFP